MSNSENELLVTGNDVSAQSSSDQRQIYTVEEIKEILGIATSTIYRLIKSKQFHCVKVGKRLLVTKKSFDEWLQYK